MENSTYLDFDNDEKAKAFDEITKMFYHHNFGSASKADIETLMFKIFMENLIKHCCDESGVLDYSRCSDYKIGKELGLTSQRVSSLKVRMELKYPQQDFDWRKSLKKLISDPKNVHRIGDNIKINIPDPNLFYAIKDYIEDNNGIVDIQLNRKVLLVSQHDFVVLLVAIADETERKKICSEVNKALRKESKDNFIKTSMSIKEITENLKVLKEFAGIIIGLIGFIP